MMKAALEQYGSSNGPTRLPLQESDVPNHTTHPHTLHTHNIHSTMVEIPKRTSDYDVIKMKYPHIRMLFFFSHEYEQRVCYTALVNAVL